MMMELDLSCHDRRSASRIDTGWPASRTAGTPQAASGPGRPAPNTLGSPRSRAMRSSTLFLAAVLLAAGPVPTQAAVSAAGPGAAPTSDRVLVVELFSS